jgi:hypothetical protein
MRTHHRGYNHARTRARILLKFAAVTAAACLTAAVAPAYAATSPAAPTPAAKNTAADPDTRAAALAQAKSSGLAVTVNNLTTVNSTTVANADGSFTTTTSAFPTRMTGPSGVWENIDPTLETLANGTLTTTATPDTLILSGGGSGALATISDAAGHSLGLGLDVALPTPTVSGPTATYTNVYPGINLVVTALPSGSFDEVFVLTDAAARSRSPHT